MVIRLNTGAECRRAAELIEQGDHRFTADDLTTARRLWTQAIDVVSPLVDRDDPAPPPECFDAAALAHWGLARIAEREGDLRAAAGLYRRASRFDELGPAPAERAAFLARRAGSLHHRSGDYQAAIECGHRAHDIDRALNPASAGTERDLNAIGYAHLARGELGIALQMFNDALAIDTVRGQNDDETAALLNNLGQVYRHRGDLRRALDHHIRALRIDLARDAESDDSATSLNNVALAYKELGDVVQAELHYERALAIDQARDPASLATARDLSNLGKLERAVADLGGGEAAHRKEYDYIRRALTIVERRAPGSPEHANLLNNLADSLLSLGDRDGARTHYQRALDLVRGGLRRNDLEVVLLGNLGELAAQDGDHDAAITFLDGSIAAAEDLRTHAGSQQAREELFSRHQRPYRAIIAGLLARDHPADAATALSYAERARARAAADLLTARPRNLADLPGGAGLRQRELELMRAVARAYNALRGAEAGVRAAAAPTTDALLTDRLTTEVSRLEEQLDDVRARISTLAAAPAEPAMDAADIATFQRGLPDGVLVVEYLVAAEVTFVWAVSRAEVHLGPAPLGGHELAELVGQALTGYDADDDRVTGLPSTQDARASRSRARELLSHRLLDPVPERMWTGVTRLVVVADGALHRLPFEVLDRGGTPLGAGTVVSYAPSLRILHLITTRPRTERRAAGEQFIGFAGPEFDPSPGADGIAGGQFARRRLSLSPLPGARAEVESACALLGSAGRALVGTDATEFAVKQHAGSYAYVHFATHGFLDADNPLYSGLALSVPTPQERARSDEPLDDFLQVYEIAELDLTAELVVCSACQTAAGTFLAGEGLIGLSRAFLTAGARNLIVSLWPVSDRLTRRLMRLLYQELAQERPVAEALHRAKAAIRERHPDPYHWAAFILIGPG